MKNLFLILIIGAFASHASAQEYNNRHKIYIEIGYSGGAYNSSFAGGVFGAAGAFFKTGNKQSALDFRVKEIYINSPQREAGAISVTYRLFLIKGFYLGAGFAHHHEIAMDKYVEAPVDASMGMGKYLIHRTGLAFESGYDFKPFPRNKGYGIYPTTNLSLAYLLFDKEPNPVVMLSIGFRFGFINTMK